MSKRNQRDIDRLASCIYRLRIELRQTQEAMARKLGYPLSSYVRWEKGRVEPGATVIFRMIDRWGDRAQRIFLDRAPEASAAKRRHIA